MSTYKNHALREFRAAGWMDENGVFEDEMQELMCKQVIELLELFDNHGHSGSSAPYAIRLFSELAAFEPIVPLTGEDFEWNEIGENKWQNNRCNHVFKGKDGKAYDIDEEIFIDKNGGAYTSIDSRVYITFPYTPKRKYIEDYNESE